MAGIGPSAACHRPYGVRGSGLWYDSHPRRPGVGCQARPIRPICRPGHVRRRGSPTKPLRNEPDMRLRLVGFLYISTDSNQKLERKLLFLMH